MAIACAVPVGKPWTLVPKPRLVVMTSGGGCCVTAATNPWAIWAAVGVAGTTRRSRAPGAMPSRSVSPDPVSPALVAVGQRRHHTEVQPDLAENGSPVPSTEAALLSVLAGCATYAGMSGIVGRSM